MKVDLRTAIPREEFDHVTLLAVLRDYASPRAKITTLLRDGSIVRVKQGLYVLGPSLSRRPHSLETLANLIYGPSIVSLEWALAHHGMIPERVTAVTSTTPKRPKTFDTPLGRFVYRCVPRIYHPLGIERVERGDIAFLIASPERALADTLREGRGSFNSRAGLEAWLVDGMRIERDRLRDLDPALLDRLAEISRSRKIALAARLVRHLKERP